jgi:zona occludens toxin
MITGLEGIPGSGTSYEATVFHVLATLKTGRKVITNLPLVIEQFAALDLRYTELLEVRTHVQPVRGTWDATRKTAFELFPDGRLEDPPARTKLFGHVWDYYSEWKDEKGRGPLFVIDECHVMLKRMKTDEHVIEYFKLHRHYNVDVLLMTQRFRDVEEEISGLMGMLIRVRKADILGRKDSYIRKVHGGYPRGAVLSTEERPYQPQFFPLYKSHTQGNSVAELGATDVRPMSVNFNRMKWAWCIACVPICAWAFWPKGDPEKVTQMKAEKAARDQARMQKAHPFLKDLDPPRPPAAPASGSKAPEPVQAANVVSAGAVTGRPEKQAVAVVDGVPEPFAGRGIHMTGVVRMAGKSVWTFAISHNSVFVNTLTGEELAKMGYRFQSLTDCAGVLRYGESVRSLTCDSPKIMVSAMGAKAEMPQYQPGAAGYRPEAPVFEAPRSPVEPPERTF